jgi:hypothetical protein
MTERLDTDLFEMLLSQIAEQGEINVILGKQCAYCSRPSPLRKFAICNIAATEGPRRA